MSIENPTLVHFRHFSSLFTNLPSTSVENALQISSFYAKQTQFPKSQMNVKSFLAVDYENISNWTLGENKANTKPIKANFRKAAMFLNFYSTKDYERNDIFAVPENKANSNPIKANFKGKKISSIRY